MDGGKIGPVYWACYLVQSVNFKGHFSCELFRFGIPLLHSGAKAVGKDALKTGPYLISYILNKEPQQPVCDIYETRFSEAKGNLEVKIK